MMLSPHSIIILIFAGFSGLLTTVLFIVAVTTDSWEKQVFRYDLINKSLPEKTRFSIAEPLWSGVDKTEQVGLLLKVANSSKGFCIVNMEGGVWQACNKLHDPNNMNATNCTMLDDMWPGKNCYNYISDYRARRNQPGSFTAAEHILKMQNNTIACCIVVLLCVIASTVTGLLGVFLRVVPAVMVTGVLYLMGGIFNVFSNSIQHEKMRRSGAVEKHVGADTCEICECYSVLGVPKEFCSELFMSTEFGWSLVLSWVTCFGYFLSCGLWLYFTRLIRLDTAKSIL